MRRLARTQFSRKSAHSRSAHGHIGIIGCGGVGTACAASLIHRRTGKMLSLFDRDGLRCLGEVQDLEDKGAFQNIQVFLEHFPPHKRNIILHRLFMHKILEI
jgi:hypothetical protein